MDQNHLGFCPCVHHKMAPLFVLLIGAAILLKASGYLSAASTDIAIGIFLVLVGLQKLLAGKCKCYESKK